MNTFDFQPRTRIIFGPGKLDELGQMARDLGASRALVVSDPGIVAAGHVGHAVECLNAAGIDNRVFDAVCQNPTTETVERAVAAARQYGPDLLIGLGGGSAMDCTKGANFILAGGGQIQDYWGIGKARGTLLPMIAVPTTSGTGSEAQSFALISDATTHVKMACGDPQAAFRVAILDPVLTISQPARVTAVTGLDALAHAIETFVTRKRNVISLALSREAWLLLAENFGRVLEHPADLEARGAMQVGACLAGMAIENSMLGAAHALANPLTARYGVIHGEAIGLMLPHVIRFNAERHENWYRDLLESAPSGNGCPDPSHGSEGLANFVEKLAKRAGLAERLSQCGVEKQSLQDMAGEAAAQWTARFNPREVAPHDLLALYEQAF